MLRFTVTLMLLDFIASKLCAQPIVISRIAQSVGLLVGLSSSEPGKNGCSDRDAVCVDDSGDHRETPMTIADRFGRILYCVHSTQYSLLVHIACVWLCTNVAYNTTQNSSDFTLLICRQLSSLRCCLLGGRVAHAHTQCHVELWMSDDDKQRRDANTTSSAADVGDDKNVAASS